MQLAEFPSALADNAGKNVRLLGQRGLLERIALSDGQPVLARLVIRAPDVDGNSRFSTGNRSQRIQVSAANDSGIFGGLTLNVSVDEDAAQVKNIIYTQE